MAKDKFYNKLMHTMRWLLLRRDKLTASPLCERCQQEGRLTPATEVHHITPVERGLTKGEKERLAFDPLNLRALCHPCHVLTHIEMGRSGKAQARQRAAAQLESYKKRFL